MKDRIQELIHMYLDGSAVRAEEDELRLLLEKHPEHIETLFRTSEDHIDLRAVLAEESSALAATGLVSGPARRFRRWLVPLAAAATILIVAGYYRHMQHATRRSLMLTVVQIAGAVERAAGDTAVALALDAVVRPGDLVTTGKDGSATMKYPDGTVLVVGARSMLTLLPRSKAKRLQIHCGTLVADIAPQPRGDPLVMSTPHWDVEVLGTRLTLTVRQDTTRVELSEGRARVTRLADGETMDIRPGRYVLQSRELKVRTVEDHEGKLNWKQYEHSNPIGLERCSSNSYSGAYSLRLSYEQPRVSRWTYGQVTHPFTLQPSDKALRLHILLESFVENASWNIAFMMGDRSCWLIDSTMCWDLAPGWNVIDLPLPDNPERQTRHGGPYDPAKVRALVFSMCQKPAVVLIDDFQLLEEQ